MRAGPSSGEGPRDEDRPRHVCSSSARLGGPSPRRPVRTLPRPPIGSAPCCRSGAACRSPACCCRSRCMPLAPPNFWHHHYGKVARLLGGGPRGPVRGRLRRGGAARDRPHRAGGLRPLHHPALVALHGLRRDPAARLRCRARPAVNTADAGGRHRASPPGWAPPARPCC
ncbi:MAG: sodium:proton antiporter [Desulfobacterales bacterium]|nr:sodium:proton antiporter [Desulfobacterales bacterium]